MPAAFENCQGGLSANHWQLDMLTAIHPQSKCMSCCLQWEHARAKISQAEQEARHVEYKMREAADLARRSNEARSEAEQAMQLEQETRSAAKDLPGRTRAYLYDTRCTIIHY